VKNPGEVEGRGLALLWQLKEIYESMLKAITRNKMLHA